MRFEFGCQLDYQVVAPTTLFLNVEAQGNEHQLLETQSLSITPSVPLETYRAPESGNLYRRVFLEPGQYTVRYDARVQLMPLEHDPLSVAELDIPHLPFSTLTYMYPSRYCQSDQMRHFAWREFGSEVRGHQRVTVICNWIYENVEYLAGSSQGETSAYETFSRRAGVCRDFAHLGITFCRALGIPARFVSAYGWQLAPPDFHAVFEAYLSGRWYLFDATRLCPLDGIVRIGVGHDAAHAAFSTYYGTISNARQMIWVNQHASEAVRSGNWTTAAVSTAAE
jgi:transglutaminase-like putative cysteine protease